VLPIAELVADARMESMEDCAAAKPMTADRMVALEKYILNMMSCFSKWDRILLVSKVGE
jgi:hypothetical protein